LEGNGRDIREILSRNFPGRTEENHGKPLIHSWSGALLEKLPIVQLLEKFPKFYGTRSFITAFI
jgi:hypothetical protein